MFDFKKKRKNKTPLMPPKSQAAQTKTSPSSNQNSIAQKNKVEASNEIEQTAQIIREDVTSAVATLRAWLNQDKLH